MKNIDKKIYVTEQDEFFIQLDNRHVLYMRAFNKSINRRKIINDLIIKKMKELTIQNY